jgi:hypothetical protein
VAQVGQATRIPPTGQGADGETAERRARALHAQGGRARPRSAARNNEGPARDCREPLSAARYLFVSPSSPLRLLALADKDRVVCLGSLGLRGSQEAHGDDIGG